MRQDAILNEIATEAHDLVTRVERLVGASVVPPGELLRALRVRALQLEDPTTTYDAAKAIMWALWPYEDPTRGWWATDTGQACALALGFHRTVCPFTQASYILNVSRQRVYQLTEQGRLVRMEVGEGVSPTSLREHLWTYGRRPSRR